ncbi:30S ribosome-binding factor RbfA [Hwanghaeella sp.]|uniref:30S ribosome-binding factor RbfA n=1 Tax=Hwanghaeella sp. TaxID=2605943 RepID=UPI003CCB99F9
MNRGKGPSQRQLRVGEELRHALSEVFQREGFRDPALQGVILTVTEVRPSPDLRNATVFISPLGGGDIKAILAGLRRASHFLRGEVARRIHLKYMPDFSFKADTSFDEAAKIDAALRDPVVAHDVHGDDDHDEDDADRSDDDFGPADR